MMNKKGYFFAYSKQLSAFLHMDKGIEYITIAQDPKSKKLFTLFKFTKEVEDALDEYKKLTKKAN